MKGYTFSFHIDIGNKLLDIMLEGPGECIHFTSLISNGLYSIKYETPVDYD